MDELSIKIKIADREYPMKVKRHEEERVRAAGKLINEKLKSYREQFGLDDKVVDFTDRELNLIQKSLPDYEERIRVRIGRFHVYAHGLSCQILFSTLRTAGFGLVVV